MTKRVIIWTHPRSLSTALLLSLGRLDKVEPRFELFSAPFYMGPDRVSARAKDTLVPDATFSNAREKLFAPAKVEGNIVVDKEITATFAGKINEEFIPVKDTVHVFLIRNPKRSISSIFKLIKTFPANSGFDFSEYDNIDMSYESVKEVFDFVVKHQTGQIPTVIDADDIIADPSASLKKLCAAIGIEYNEKCLHWMDVDKGVLAEWGDFWFQDLFASTGWKANPKIHETWPDLDEEMKKWADLNMPFYDMLKVHKI